MREDDQFFTIILFILTMITIIVIITILGCLIADQPKYNEDHGYRTYVTVYYPDQNKSVEGYLDEFSLGHNYTCRIVIEGVEYTCDSRNVIFSMRRLD